MSIILCVLAATFFTLNAVPVGAQEEQATKVEKPDHDLVMAMRYPVITIGPEDKIRVDMYIKDRGKSDETVFFNVVEMPKGWKTEIKGYGDIIGGLFIAEGEDRTLTFTAMPADAKVERIEPGEYKFVIKAETSDKTIDKTTSLVVRVVEGQKINKGITLTTSYPVLSGPSDSKFEFSLDVANNTDADDLFNLSAAMPEGWDVSFKPPYEQKQISSLQIKSNQSKSVNVEVTPPADAKAGEYPFNVKVQSSGSKASVDLKVNLSGTYKIKTGTMDGLLSLTAEKGKTATVSLYVRNQGSADQKQITFLSFKPENWKVEFIPEKIEDLKAGDLKQVEIKVTPAEQALVGDYSVAVQAQGEKASETTEFRVTVKASSTWGWIGIGIIILVIIGLAVIFRRLGRR